MEKEPTFTPYKFNAFKNINPINCDSETLENYLMLLEYDQSIKSYFATNLSLIVEYARMEAIVPIDLIVSYKLGKTFLVRFQKETNNENENLANHSAIQAACSKFCMSTNLFYLNYRNTNNEISIKMKNIKILSEHFRLHIPEDLGFVIEFFSHEKSPTIDRFQEFLKHNLLNPDLAFTLIFHNYCFADLDFHLLHEETPIFMQTKVNKQVKDEQKSFFSNVDFEVF